MHSEIGLENRRLLVLAENRPLTALFFLLAAAMLLLPGTVSLPLMDRDEPRFAQATWEMMEGRQWLIPYFNGEYRFDKPPLTYWWMRIHYRIFGKTEFAARLHSVLAAWLTAVAVAELGRFLFSARAGFWAGMGWLTCLQVMVHGRLCVADMPMILSVTASMLAICRLLLSEAEPGRFGPWFWVLTAALALGFLAKGPVAWATPLLGLLLTRWVFWRQSIPWKRLQPVTALTFATVVVGLWGVPSLLATQGEFWNVGIGEHVVKRGAAAFNSRVTVPMAFYLVTAFVSLLPWSPFAPAALFSGQSSRSDPKRSLLLGWFAAPFLIFGFYATQLPHYILPGFPAFFLLLFRSGSLPSAEKRGRKWFLITTLVFGLTGIGLGMLAVWLPWRELGNLPRLGATVATGIFLVGMAFPWAIRSRNLRWGAALAAVVASLLFGYGGKLIRGMHPVIAMVENSWAHLPEQTRFQGIEFTEPSLVFYQDSHGPWRLFGNHERGNQWFRREGPPRAGVYLLREWTAQDALKTHIWKDYKGKAWPPSRDSRDKVQIDPARHAGETVQGFNAARSSWVELLVVTPAEN